LQLVSLMAQLIERPLEGCVEACLIHPHANLAGDLFQRLICLGRERFGLARPLRNDDAEQLPTVADRCHPDVGVQPAIEELRQPYSRPS